MKAYKQLSTFELLMKFYEEWSNCKTDEDFKDVETFYTIIFDNRMNNKSKQGNQLALGDFADA